MNLIRIGTLIINLERVTSIRALPAAGESDPLAPGALRLCFEGAAPLDIYHHSDALWGWLVANAQVVA